MGVMEVLHFHKEKSKVYTSFEDNMFHVIKRAPIFGNLNIIACSNNCMDKNLSTKQIIFSDFDQCLAIVVYAIALMRIIMLIQVPTNYLTQIVFFPRAWC